MCSELIFQLLEAQELDPLHHGHHDDQEELLDNDDDATPVRKRKRASSTIEITENVRNSITRRKEIEERNLPAFEKRGRNMEDIEGITSLDDGEISE